MSVNELMAVIRQHKIKLRLNDAWKLEVSPAPQVRDFYPHIGEEINYHKIELMADLGRFNFIGPLFY